MYLQSNILKATCYANHIPTCDVAGQNGERALARNIREDASIISAYPHIILRFSQLSILGTVGD